MSGASAIGKVYLVGGGPGPLELLTLRALRCLQQAQVLIYDRLVNPEVLEQVPPDCQRINAGKASGHHLLPQQQINALIVAHALAGKTVVRLKGGDPSVFGRAAEEMTALRAAGIPCEVVPGVTAASSCAAAAGFSLTHRDLSHSCVLLAGHGADGDQAHDWAALARPGQTRVFYMGVERLRHIGSQLLAHGLSPDTPAALVFSGLCAGQQVIACTLAQLMARNPGYQRAPGLLIIGETVALSPHFEGLGPVNRP